ncbi:hypothetical protein ACH4GE_36995 [Streptomyces tendae]|uniref:hypothetical protein n=1 Tax=Streptomyces tendae TaxID=1932 RepID=UPI0037B864EE
MAEQQFDEGATRGGIQVLEQAFTSIQQRQQNIQSTASSLASKYGGSDGGKYKQLLEQWDGHVDTILINLDKMVDELNESLKEHGLTQQSGNEQIDQAYNRSTQVFDELNGARTSAGAP